MSTSGYPQGHALIIAVATYHHINSLPVVVLNDAREVARILGSPQYCGYNPANIKQLLNDFATRKAVLEGLNDLAARTGPDDTACVYFSGHGALTGGIDESSLLPVDCTANDLAGTSISAAEFSDALQQIKAKRLIIFLDACHAAGAGSLKNAASADNPKFGFSEKTLAHLATGTGRALMASSKPSETSLIMHGAHNSAFTAALIEGLTGAADRNGDGVIKVFDLFDYVSRQVPQTTNDAQHPIFKASQLEQNFPIALSRGGTKTPSHDGAGGAGNVADSSSWQELAAILPILYPAGPNDQEIWERAGGDISRLRLQGTGRATWFAAIKVLEQGGGGAGISINSLVDASLEDFPGHHGLADIRHRR
ncbi:MAG: caspase family protein [Moraxellaceae bacterium]